MLFEWDRDVSPAMQCWSSPSWAAEYQRKPVHLQGFRQQRSMAECLTSAERTRDGCSPTNFLRKAGILKYGREAGGPWHCVHPEPSKDCAANCEFCGEKASPLSPYLTKEERTETVFCCAQRQQLCLSSLEICDSGTNRLTPQTNTQLYCQTKEHEDFQLIMDSPNLMSLQMSGRVLNLSSHDDEPTRFAVFQGFCPSPAVCQHDNSKTTNVIILQKQQTLASEDYSTLFQPVTRFQAQNVLRLSCASADTRWVLCNRNMHEMCVNINEDAEKEEASVRDDNSTHFGKFYPQAVAGRLLQKFYSNGNKFLTAFPNGSAQVFYPSGRLALIVTVADGKGRVCIVFDDAKRSNQRIRAVFLSNGKATCYHSNGNIWLNMHNLGGQYLDKAGARVHQWTWRIPGQNRTPLKPIFLSLNKAIGVRVLSREEIFVSFLASGQQAKFRVGSFFSQVEHKSLGPGLLEEEEIYLVEAKIRINQVIQTLHQCLLPPSGSRLPKTGPGPHRHAVTKKTARTRC